MAGSARRAATGNQASPTERSDFPPRDVLYAGAGAYLLRMPTMAVADRPDIAIQGHAALRTSLAGAVRCRSLIEALLGLPTRSTVPAVRR